MERVKFCKTLSSLPPTEELTTDTLYFVRVGAGFDLYLTTKKNGVIIPRKINQSGQIQTDWLEDDINSLAFIKNKPKNYSNILNNTLSTSSTTFVPVSGLIIEEILPGKYFLNFGCSLNSSQNNGSIFSRILVNGVELQESEMEWKRGQNQGNIISTHNYSGFPIDLGSPLPVIPEYAEIGSGTLINGTKESSPVNNYWRRCVCQMVYRADELIAKGFQAGSEISEIGWFITNTFNQDKPGYTIKMKHTSQNDVSTALGLTGWIEVKAPFTYTQPRPINDWDMIPLDNNFTWDGVSNIGVEVCWAQTAGWSETGQMYIYNEINGYRYSWDDNTGTLCGTEPATVNNNKPQVRFKASNLQQQLPTNSNITIVWRVSGGTGNMVNPYLSLIGV